MAVAFRAKAELTALARTNSTLTKPTGTADDDILVVALEITSGTSVTAPAGWTEYSGSPFTSFTTFATRMYWKRAASEGASWTWTHLSAISYAEVCAYSGAITSGDPNDCTPTHNTGGSDKNVVALSITIATDQSLGIIFWTNLSNTGGQTPPSGFTEHGGPNNTFGAEDKLLGTGATGDQTTVIVNNDSWDTFFLALKPPAAGGGFKPFPRPRGEIAGMAQLSGGIN